MKITQDTIETVKAFAFAISLIVGAYAFIAIPFAFYALVQIIK